MFYIGSFFLYKESLKCTQVDKFHVLVKYQSHSHPHRTETAQPYLIYVKIYFHAETVKSGKLVSFVYVETH